MQLADRYLEINKDRPLKVLVIRFSSIGDIVLTTPVLRCFKQSYPNGQLHYLTKKAFGPILESNPHINRLFLLDGDLSSIIPELKAEGYDFIIDLHNNLRSHRVIRALKVRSNGFRKLNMQKWLLTNLKINLLPDSSIVSRYLSAAGPLGITDDGKGLDYFLPAGKKLASTDIPVSHWGGYVGCVIGGSYATKKLPVSSWISFCTDLPFPVMLLGGPEDRADGDAIAAGNPVKIYNSCGKFSLNESAELVQYARVIVSNDTGLMHIAAAFRKPVVSLWGNTTPGMGMFPYYGGNNVHSNPATLAAIVQNSSPGCRPCSKLGYHSCPKGHFRCMNELDMKEVVRLTRKFWEGA